MMLLCYAKVGNVIDNKAPLEWIDLSSVDMLIPMKDFVWRRDDNILTGDFTFWEVITKDGFYEYAYPIFSGNFNEETITSTYEEDDDWIDNDLEEDSWYCGDDLEPEGATDYADNQHTEDRSS